MVVFQPSGKHVLRSMKPCDLSSCSKSEIKAYFENSFDLYETLFKALKDESAFYKCPDRLRLPLIFYFGHTAAVYVNKLVLGGLLKERINFEYETLFETGVDEMSWDDTENYRMGGSFVWPTVAKVAEYRKKVRKAILDVIDNTPLELPVTQESKWWAVFMGFEHERIHFETSSVLIRQMPLELVRKPLGWKDGPITAGDPVSSNPLIEIAEQSVSLGKPENFPSYGWDNEYGQWNVKVPSFKASKYLITNREYLEFVNSGGYENSKYWTKEGWRWKQFRQIHHPSFWVCNNQCKSGCGSDLVTYSHCKLGMTDVNHNPLLGNGVLNGISNGSINGDHHDGFSNGVLNGHGNGTVNGAMNGTYVQNGSPNGHVENGDHDELECPYKYRAMFEVIDMPMDWPAEVNYHEAKAYCTWKGPEFRLPTEAEHHLIRGPQKSPLVGTSCDIIYQDKIEANINMAYGSSTGGSWVSTGDEASRFARFAFRRHFFQHLGFRLAQSVSNSPPVRLVGTPVFVLGVGVEENPISLPGISDSEVYVNTVNMQYHDDAEDFLYAEVLSNYGDLLGVESDAGCCEQLAEICKEAIHKHNGCPVKKALDIMCSVGRFSFELSKSLSEVIAIDHSGRLLDAAMKIQQGKSLEIKGARDLPFVNIPLDEIKANVDRVQFQQFTWLPNEIGVYDLIVMLSLQRLSNPKAWLVRLWEIMNSGGILIIKTNVSWNLESLRAVLGTKFELVETRLVSSKREGLRKSDMCHSSVTIWRLMH
ncbi:uncharacterized protein [Porites lutea]|uniref:uncharacterized protein isoform X2 n=1 Tax=Porites lutea TaxID=51062 RepID=UPI003CC5C4A0